MINKEKSLASVEVTGYTPIRNRRSLGRIARVCAVVTAVAVLPAHHSLADADDENIQTSTKRFVRFGELGCAFPGGFLPFGGKGSCLARSASDESRSFNAKAEIHRLIAELASVQTPRKYSIRCRSALLKCSRVRCLGPHVGSLPHL